MHLWQKYHRNSTMFSRLHPIRWHMNSICPITDDIHLHHLVKTASAHLLHCEVTIFTVLPLAVDNYFYINILFLMKLAMYSVTNNTIDSCFLVLFCGPQFFSCFVSLLYFMLWGTCADHAGLLHRYTHGNVVCCRQFHFLTAHRILYCDHMLLIDG